MLLRLTGSLATGCLGQPICPGEEEAGGEGRVGGGSWGGPETLNMKAVESPWKTRKNKKTKGISGKCAKNHCKKTEKPEKPRFCATMGAGSGKGGKARPPVVSDNLVFFVCSVFFFQWFLRHYLEMPLVFFGFSGFSGGFCKVGFWGWSCPIHSSHSLPRNEFSCVRSVVRWPWRSHALVYLCFFVLILAKRGFLYDTGFTRHCGQSLCWNRLFSCWL